MKITFKITPKDEIKWFNIHEWHKWFAWYPVFIENTDGFNIVWLQYVLRRYKIVFWPDTWIKQYKLGEDE